MLSEKLVVQLDRAPRGVVLRDDSLERNEHTAAAQGGKQRVELCAGKAAKNEHLVRKTAGSRLLSRGEPLQSAEIANRVRKLFRCNGSSAYAELKESETDLLQSGGILDILKQCACHHQNLLSTAVQPFAP